MIENYSIICEIILFGTLSKPIFSSNDNFSIFIFVQLDTEFPLKLIANFLWVTQFQAVKKYVTKGKCVMKGMSKLCQQGTVYCISCCTLISLMSSIYFDSKRDSSIHVKILSYMVYPKPSSYTATLAYKLNTKLLSVQSAWA